MQHEFRLHGVPHFKKKCKKCGHGTNLSNHKCSSDKNKEYPCKECGKVYQIKKNLRIHHKSVHMNLQKTHLCKTCNKGFADYELLEKHVYQSHNKVNCPQCQKTLFNKSELRRHLVFEHGMTDSALFCNICPKAVFFQKYHFNKHMVEKHGISVDEKD